jgi:ABC-2 type transport system permease protein
MSTASDTNATPPEAQTRTQAAVAPTRPFYWSVRRELWEHRSIWIAPLAVAGFVLFGFLIRLARLPQMLRTVSTLPPMKQTLAYVTPFAGAAGAIVITGLIVAAFYCLGTLNGERRDRSILFWKSLPVSDLTAVLAKATLPFLIVPPVVFVITILTQLIMLVVGSAVLLANGMDAGQIWAHWPMAKMSLTLIYILVVITLWYAPIYGWLLLVSAWARRMTILWAVLTPLGIAVVERIAFDTSYFGGLIKYRIGGFVDGAFISMPKKPPPMMHTIDPLALLAPMKFLSSPGLWLGLVFAAAFIAGAVWLRRGREPA